MSKFEREFNNLVEEYNEMTGVTYTDATREEQKEIISGIEAGLAAFFKKIPDIHLKKAYARRFSEAIKTNNVLKEHIVKPKIDLSIMGNAIKIKTKTQSKRGGKRRNRTKKYRNKSKSNKRNRKI
jgi:hypothetical protein